MEDEEKWNAAVIERKRVLNTAPTQQHMSSHCSDRPSTEGGKVQVDVQVRDEASARGIDVEEENGPSPNHETELVDHSGPGMFRPRELDQALENAVESPRTGDFQGVDIDAENPGGGASARGAEAEASDRACGEDFGCLTPGCGNMICTYSGCPVYGPHGCKRCDDELRGGEWQREMQAEGEDGDKTDSLSSEEEVTKKTEEAEEDGWVPTSLATNSANPKCQVCTTRRSDNRQECKLIMLENGGTVLLV
jgi:hypothetical protein